MIQPVDEGLDCFLNVLEQDSDAAASGFLNSHSNAVPVPMNGGTLAADFLVAVSGIELEMFCDCHGYLFSESRSTAQHMAFALNATLFLAAFVPMNKSPHLYECSKGHIVSNFAISDRFVKAF